MRRRRGFGKSSTRVAPRRVIAPTTCLSQAISIPGSSPSSEHGCRRVRRTSDLWRGPSGAVHDPPCRSLAKARRVETLAPGFESCARDAAPAEVLELSGQRDVDDEGRELAIKHCAIHLDRKYLSESWSRPDLRRPLARVARDIFDA